MSDGLFSISEACGCNKWNCRSCHPREPMQGALRMAPDWVERADAWFQSQPKGTLFTSEDVTAAIGFPSGGNGTNRNNAVGAWVQKLSRQSVIERSHAIQSRNPASNGATIWVWMKR